MIGYLKTCMSQITAGNICVFNTFHSTTDTLQIHKYSDLRQKCLSTCKWFYHADFANILYKDLYKYKQ